MLFYLFCPNRYENFLKVYKLLFLEYQNHIFYILSIVFSYFLIKLGCIRVLVAGLFYADKIQDYFCNNQEQPYSSYW